MLRPSALLPSSLLLLAACAAGPTQVGRGAEAGTSLQLQPAVHTVATAAPPARREVIRRILPHNVRLLVREDGEVRRTASGVVVGSESTPSGRFSYVLTNAHAVVQGDLKDPKLVVAVERQGEEHEYLGEVVAMGRVPEMDLALVRCWGVALAPARVAEDSELEVGEDVVVAASPYGRSISLSGGMVSQVEWDKDARVPAMLKTDAPIGYGASGGGIYSLSTGHLLAIVEGYRTARVGFAVAEQNYSFDVPMPGETFAAPSSKVRRFLEEQGYGRLLQPAGQRERPAAVEARRERLTTDG